ncbi:hypothetical protein D3C83_116790 [compost metagenome]
MARCFVARTANRRFLELEFKRQATEHLEGLGNDLLADAVARQHRDFHRRA